MTSRGWRYLNDFFLFLLAAYTLLSLFWTCFQCTPPAAMWDKVYSGKLAVSPVCWSTPVISNVLSTVHVVMDFCLLTTPVIVLWKVKLPTATKIRLYLVFSTGALSCIGSVLRQIEQHKISLDVTCTSPPQPPAPLTTSELTLPNRGLHRHPDLDARRPQLRPPRRLPPRHRRPPPLRLAPRHAQGRLLTAHPLQRRRRPRLPLQLAQPGDAHRHRQQLEPVRGGRHTSRRRVRAHLLRRRPGEIPGEGFGEHLRRKQSPDGARSRNSLRIDDDDTVGNCGRLG